MDSHPSLSTFQDILAPKHLCLTLDLSDLHVSPPAPSQISDHTPLCSVTPCSIATLPFPNSYTFLHRFCSCCCLCEESSSWPPLLFSLMNSHSFLKQLQRPTCPRSFPQASTSSNTTVSLILSMRRLVAFLWACEGLLPGPVTWARRKACLWDYEPGLLVKQTQDRI